MASPVGPLKTVMLVLLQLLMKMTFSAAEVANFLRFHVAKSRINNPCDKCTIIASFRD